MCIRLGGGWSVRISCPSVTNVENNELYYYDDNHLTLAGARFLADQIFNCEELACQMIRAVVDDKDVANVKRQNEGKFFDQDKKFRR